MTSCRCFFCFFLGGGGGAACSAVREEQFSHTSILTKIETRPLRESQNKCFLETQHMHFHFYLQIECYYVEYCTHPASSTVLRGSVCLEECSSFCNTLNNTYQHMEALQVYPVYYCLKKTFSFLNFQIQYITLEKKIVNNCK